MLKEFLLNLSIFEILILITLKFFFYLIIRHTFKWHWLCAICASISSTWISMLALLYVYGPLVVDRTTIALFMGMSILAVYYLVEKKYAAEYGLFRLPFLLTLTYVGFLLLSPVTEVNQQQQVWGFMFLIVLWAIFETMHEVMKKLGKN